MTPRRDGYGIASSLSTSPWHLPSLDGLRIVHLSDLHIGDFMPRAAIRRAADLANTAQADLAVLIGDLITSDRDPLEDCIAEVSRLRAPLGVWGCHGNHERSAGVEGRAQALFARYGMHLLRQQCAELSWRGGRFNLIGVDDQRERARAGEPSSILRGIEARVRSDIPNILLAQSRYLSGPRGMNSASRATPMAASSVSRSGTAGGARPVSSRRSWRDCTACRSAPRGTPQAMKSRRALQNQPSCM
jgi:hypothetical protein